MIFRAIFWTIVSRLYFEICRISHEGKFHMVIATDPWGVKVERVEM